jgi:hypothetical protein
VDPLVRTVGTGRNKFSAEALSAVSTTELEAMELRSSMVTAELHDDPDLFVNNRITTPSQRGIKKNDDDFEEVDDDNDDDITSSIIEKRTF